MKNSPPASATFAGSATVPASSREQRLRLAISILVAAAALTYVFSGLEWRLFGAALSRIDYLGFTAVVGVLALLVLAADALAIAYVFRRYVGPVPYRSVLLLRGASYLPSVVNYHLGQAWLTWVLSRAHGTPIWRNAGVTLLNYAGMFASVFALGGLSFALAPRAFPWLGPVLSTVALLAVVYFALLHFGKRWLARLPPARVLAEAGLGGHLAALAVRVPHATVLFLCTWLPFGFFGVSIPLADALCLVPILVLVGALPLTPQGVGTREVVAVELLSGYAPGATDAERAAAVTACCLCWVIAATLFEGMLSLFCAPMARRLIARQDAS